MKKSIKYILLCTAFIGIIVLAVTGYNYLSRNYETGEKNEIPNQTGKLQKAIDFTVVDKSGNTVHLKDNYGKPVIVNFWATWCGPCRTEMPAFNSLYEIYKNDVTLMMVNMTDGYQDTISKVNDFIRKNEYTFPVYFDTEYSAASAYSVNSVPTTLFINESGEIAYKHIGMMDEENLKSYIENLLDK